jgi:hypothetical protein
MNEDHARTKRSGYPNTGVARPHQPRGSVKHTRHGEATRTASPARHQTEGNPQQASRATGRLEIEPRIRCVYSSASKKRRKSLAATSTPARSPNGAGKKSRRGRESISPPRRRRIGWDPASVPLLLDGDLGERGREGERVKN